MARLGRSTPRASLIYQHATEQRDRQIAAGIDALLDAAKKKGREPQADIVDLERSRTNRALQPKDTEKAPPRGRFIGLYQDFLRERGVNRSVNPLWRKAASVSRVGGIPARRLADYRLRYRSTKVLVRGL